MRVFCDAHPLSISPWDIRDHSGLRIFSLTSLPLTQFHKSSNSIKPLAAINWKNSDDYKHWTFFLREDFYWEDGSPITGYDYLRGLNFLAHSPHHRFRSLLADIAGFSKLDSCSSMIGLEAQSDRIYFRLRNPNRLWPLLLSFPGTAPKHPTNPDAESGAYKIESKSKESFHLKCRDRFFKSTQKQITDIIFNFQTSLDDPFAIKKWEENALDMTWDTFFPYAKKHLFHNRSVFHQSRPQILTFLSPQGCEHPPAPELMRFLYTAIDRLKLAEQLHHCPTPIYGYCHQDLPQISSEKNHPETTLKIGYEDFFPNHDILLLLKDQLKPYGITIDPIKVEYGDRPKSLNLRLELLHNPLPDPFLMLRNEFMQKQFFDKHPVAWKRFSKLLTLYQMINNPSQNQKLSQEMDLILIEEGRIIPLLELPGFYLCKPSVGYHEFQPGQHWSWTENEKVVP